METSYLNLHVTDNVKGLVVEFASMNHFVKALTDYVKLSDEEAEQTDIENELVRVYLHALRAQKILDGMEDILQDFQKDVVRQTNIREKRPELFE